MTPFPIGGKIGTQNMPDDADDRVPVLPRCRLDPFAYRIFVRPILMREILIDHNDRLRLQAVFLGEDSSPFERNRQRLKIPRRDKSYI